MVYVMSKPSGMSRRPEGSVKNHTIASGTRFTALEDLLTEIAKLHGRETARGARAVLNKRAQS